MIVMLLAALAGFGLGIFATFVFVLFAHAMADRRREREARDRRAFDVNVSAWLRDAARD